MKKIIFTVIISLFWNISFAQTNLIFDTDFGGDADDLGALAMLNHYMNNKDCNLLAVMVWSTEEYAVPAIDAVNSFYGNPNIPIGVRKDGKHFLEWNYSKPIAEAFDYDETYESAAESTLLYRKILSESKNKDVVIVTVGPLKNIDNLIKSKADSLSPLSGKELIESKVKEFVIMGGQFPQGDQEWNFSGNMPGVTKRVIDNINVPIVFLGYEVGSEIRTGKIFNKLDENHPLFLGYKHFSAHAPWVKETFKGQILNNATYDQTAVLYAVKNGVGVYWEKINNGICIPDDKGGNKWLERKDSNHAYLKLKMRKEELARHIDSVMLGEF